MALRDCEDGFTEGGPTRAGAVGAGYATESPDALLAVLADYFRLTVD